MQGLIDIEPKQYLDFILQEGKVGQTTLNIFNLTQTKLTFKIKTTNPNMFQVKPSIGIISANDQMSIVISTSQPLKEDSKLESKFQINACVLEQEGQDLTNFWRQQDAQLIQQVQLRSRVKPLEIQQEIIQQQQLQQNVVLETNENMTRIKPAEINQEIIPQQLQQHMVLETNQSMGQLYQSLIDNSTQGNEKDEEIQKCQELVAQLSQDVSNYQLMLKSVKEQEVAIKHHGNKFELKQVMIIAGISLILGFIFGK
ncbi:unnamed protein product [Paramecium sonneborni]|uniref:MSP domain-containing protein n=1 Tax=Paramecium sonneborni TaxID=65129 RepID=A0A8S1QPB1_9CILI|nr:unnamed protein product [Paramecium sonneborni]